MSEKFIQLYIPCKECLVQAACKDKIGDGIQLNKHINYCLVLPDWDINKKPYPKGLFECWANIGWELITNLSKKDNSENSKIPLQFIDVFIDMLNSIQWMINCTSWNKGKLHQFDTIEIKAKMKYITRWLDERKE